MGYRLGIDCGSVSLNLVLVPPETGELLTVYRRTKGRPLETFVNVCDELLKKSGREISISHARATGSARELFSRTLGIASINEITAHATGVHRVAPEVKTVIEIGGQDSKFMKIGPSHSGSPPTVTVFRMNEICAAGTGAFLDEQAERLGIPIESFGTLALESSRPARIAGRCAVFAKTDMIHQAQEGVPIPDILLGVAFALARNYIASLIRGEQPVPLVALQGGVMNNEAVVHAFRTLLNLHGRDIIIPPHFEVLGALGSAILAVSSDPLQGASLSTLRSRAEKQIRQPARASCLPPLNPALNLEPLQSEIARPAQEIQGPLLMGLDIGSVSAKGVVIDASGHIVRQDYQLSRSRPIEAMADVLRNLTDGGLVPDAIAVTGSGRYLEGRLLDAELIVNEISAQAEAALSFDPNIDTVVEIGGQDSKWIALAEGEIRDFEMNRICAAGTGSFLMAQAQRLDLDMGKVFSDAAFSASAPADLGNRCTVFMESDLVHHQNNGASPGDLAAGVCISIVENYLERVANYKPLGNRVLLLGGVAATPAVRAAFEQHTERTFETPAFFKVSGALGAALKLRRGLRNGEMVPRKRSKITYDPAEIRREPFTCSGCTNRCRVFKYHTQGRTIFNGGLCERWEFDDRQFAPEREPDVFTARKRLLESLVETAPGADRKWGMVRTPQFYEWFPFWKSFCNELGISLEVAPPTDRQQFEKGSRFLTVETCLPIKALAGQLNDLFLRGCNTVFHPSILNESPCGDGDKAVEYCPYIQGSSQFFKEIFNVEWKDPIIGLAADPTSFTRDHIEFARTLGFSRKVAMAALERGLNDLELFRKRIHEEGKRFLESLAPADQAFVVLGKPYHTADTFLNMNLGRLFHRLGVRAIPSDVFPFDRKKTIETVYWKHQGDMIRVAREIAVDPRLFPVFITFFGCGPDPFTIRHIREALGKKPLLMLEMDEHSSPTGLITRIEAFLEQIQRHSGKLRPTSTRTQVSRKERPFQNSPRDTRYPRRLRPQVLYLPYFCEHSYGFAAAAKSVGIDARVLPPPDEESERLGRPHAVGGECHPYVLVLGDYLKLANMLSPADASRSLVYMLGPEACRLGQYPVYMEKVRRELGFSVRVIQEIDQGLAAFGLSKRNRQRVLIKGWEGLNAYDILFQLYVNLRSVAVDKALLDTVYDACCIKMFHALSENRVRQGMDEVLHDLHFVPVKQASSGPVVAVTGDYYTRVVSFANNQVYSELEGLGATIWAPPTLSDSFKISVLRDFSWGLRRGLGREVAHNGLLYMLMAVSEFRVKGSASVRKAVSSPLDLLGRAMWKTAAQYAPTRLPGGITAPIATSLRQLDLGGDGLLNLMTLNCSYGTVVTAALNRALKKRPGIPMLTLVYDGLKKTNEKTRLEAFMEQVWDHFDLRVHVPGRRLQQRGI